MMETTNKSILFLLATLVVVSELALGNEPTYNSNNTDTENLKICTDSKNITRTFKINPRIVAFEYMAVIFGTWSAIAPSTANRFSCREGQVWVECLNQIPNIKPTLQNEIRMQEELTKANCNEDFQTKMPCVKDVESTVSQTCLDRCSEINATFLASFQSLSNIRTIEDKRDLVGKSCKVVTCRFACRKQDIIDTCGQDSLEVTKRALQQYRNTLLATESQFSELPMPAGCSDEDLLKDL